MGDAKHPGIRQSIKEAQEGLDGYVQAWSKAKPDYDMLMALKAAGQQPGGGKGDKYQPQMNEHLAALGGNLGLMIAELSGAIEHLIKAVDLIAKQQPGRRASNDLFDSRH